MKANDRLKSPEHNLEIGTDTPNVRLILGELEEAQQYAQNYCDRNTNAARWLYSCWDGQNVDGRVHVNELGADDLYQFDGASDTRIRSVMQHVSDHVTLARFAFNGAKVQAEALRPLVPGQAREANQATTLLKWQLGTQMRGNLQLEVPLALHWRFGYGAALMGVNWWQCRRLEYHEVNVPVLADIVAAKTGQSSLEALMDVQEALANPAQFERMASFIQSLSPIVTVRQARKIVTDLQEMRTADIPVPYTFRSQPRWTAWRPGVEVLFRDLTGDLQEEPWVDWRERISETDLYDRIETEDYDPRFVDEAIQRKGIGSDDMWLQQTLSERGMFGGYSERPGWVNNYANTVELHHFIYKAHVKGVPTLFRTIFNKEVTGKDLKNPLVASHGRFPYPHGQYPAIPMRYRRDTRQILGGLGIAEIAYTWEQEEKVQADGQADRTMLENAPPLITAYNRVEQIKGEFGPRAVLGVPRGEVSWMPLPQSTGISERVMQRVQQRAERFFGIFGAELDPDLKNMRRMEISGDSLGEFALACQMTFELDQHYLADSEVSQMVGQLQMPFQIKPGQIQEPHMIRIIFDPRMADVEYVKEKLGLIQMLMPFNQGGTANTNAIFRAGMEMIDPDLAEQSIENDRVATEREKNDEKQAITQMLVGMEPDMPQFANHQLRLQVIQQALQTPGLAQRVQADKVVTELFKNRVKNLQNQIQQYQKNPAIGRAVGTTAFGNEAPQMAALPNGS